MFSTGSVMECQTSPVPMAKSRTEFIIQAICQHRAGTTSVGCDVVKLYFILYRREERKVAVRVCQSGSPFQQESFKFEVNIRIDFQPARIPPSRTKSIGQFTPSQYPVGNHRGASNKTPLSDPAEPLDFVYESTGHVASRRIPENSVLIPQLAKEFS